MGQEGAQENDDVTLRVRKKFYVKIVRKKFYVRKNFYVKVYVKMYVKMKFSLYITVQGTRRDVS